MITQKEFLMTEEEREVRRFITSLNADKKCLTCAVFIRKGCDGETTDLGDGHGEESCRSYEPTEER